MRLVLPAAVGGSLLLVAATAAPAWAAPVSWDDGGAPDADFSNAANWAGDVVPSPGDTLTFPVGDIVVNDLGTLPVSGLVLTDSEISVAGDGFEVGAEGITVTGAATITAPIATTQSQQWDVVGSLQVAGVTDVTGFLQATGTGQVNFDAYVTGSGIIEANEDSLVTIAAGGDIQGVEAHGNGTLFVTSVLPTTLVNLDSGLLSGGTLGNIGADQLLEGVAATSGTFSPGDDPLGESLGWMRFTGNVVGYELATYRVGIEGLDSDRISTAAVFQTQDLALDVQTLEPGPVGTEYVIVESAGGVHDSFFTDRATGTQLLDGAEFTAGTSRYRIDYSTVDITLTYLGEVAAPAPTPTPTPAPELAATGADDAAPALGGVSLLLMAGLALLALRRRAA